MGRPSDYSEELVGLICSRITEGESLRSICASEDMPAKSTVFRWLAANVPFQDHYARACSARADVMAEEILEIADDDSGDAIVDPETGSAKLNQEFVARSRVKIDARKWLMSKMAPKKYGDKVSQEVSGPGGGPVETLSRIELVAVPLPPRDPEDDE